MILLSIYIIIWVFLYFLEGTHDAFLTKEVNEHPPAKDYVKANYYKGRWHIWDSYSYSIFHIGFALLFAMIKINSSVDFFNFNFLSLAFVFALISVSVRMIAHDLFYDIAVGRPIFTIPTCQGKWDFWDCWIVKLNDLHPILPFVLRFAPIITTTVIYIIFFV